MKVAYVYDSKQRRTGAHHINHLIVTKLRELGVEVESFYPNVPEHISPDRFRGLRRILFFHSLLEQKQKILGANLIQGTTYTPLSFLGYGIPVVCHFGSTTWGFLKATPQTHRIEERCRSVIYELKQDGVLGEVNIRSRRPMRDIAEVELYTAHLADAVIATSELVRQELLSYGLPAEKVHVIYNAIDDSWFNDPPSRLRDPALVFLGRVSNDVFNWKLKGLDRLITIYRGFTQVRKYTLAATENPDLAGWLDRTIPSHTACFNLSHTEIREQLHQLHGSIVLCTSRYEGFSLSLVEAMSQGLIPVTFPVGVAPEIIRNGENGFLVNGVEQAKRRVREILADDVKRRKMAKAAMETAKLFRADTLASKLHDLYAAVIAGEGTDHEAEMLVSDTDLRAEKTAKKVEQALAQSKRVEEETGTARPVSKRARR